MSDQALLRQQLNLQLQRLQQNLVHLNLWQTTPPPTEKLASEQPFHLDTLDPHEWLQWIFIPRMTALLESDAALPNRIAISPYIEETMADLDKPELLLQPLTDIEALLHEHR